MDIAIRVSEQLLVSDRALACPITVEDMDSVLGEAGVRVLAGPYHLAKNSDNQFVVYSGLGIVLLEERQSGVVRQMELFWNLRDSPLEGLKAFSGHVDFSDFRVSGTVPMVLERRLRAKASREFLGALVFECNGFTLFLKVRRQRQASLQRDVEVESVSIGMPPIGL